MIDLKAWFICSIVFSWLCTGAMANTGRQGPESIAYRDKEYRKKYQLEVGFRNKAYRSAIDMVFGYVWWVILFLLINELAAVPQSIQARDDARAYNDKVGVPLTCDILSISR